MFARLFAPAAALCLLALSGCGGGGGGGGATVSPGPGGGGGTGAADFALPANADGAVAAVAANRPRPGSVTQSSNGANGVTVDHVEVTMSGPGNLPQVVVTNNPDGSAGGWTVNSADATGDNIAREDDAVIFLTPGTGGRRWVALRSDRAGQTDTDYLVYGIWAWIPDDASQIASFEVGVFADGGDPFTGADILALTGTAEYRGEAHGIYSYTDPDDDDVENDLFEADAVLTANFGAADAAGTISGRIVNPRGDDGEPVADPGEEIVVNLGAANIGTGDGGFFAGAASMTFDGIPHTGQWGGEFFGNGATGPAPGSVAGTFGVAATDPERGRATLVGAFGANR